MLEEPNKPKLVEVSKESLMFVMRDIDTRMFRLLRDRTVFQEALLKVCPMGAPFDDSMKEHIRSYSEWHLASALAQFITVSHLAGMAPLDELLIKVSASTVATDRDGDLANSIATEIHQIVGGHIAES